MVTTSLVFTDRALRISTLKTSTYTLQFSFPKPLDSGHSSPTARYFKPTHSLGPPLPRCEYARLFPHNHRPEPSPRIGTSKSPPAPATRASALPSKALLEEDQPPVTRAAAASYIASSCAQSVDREGVVQVLCNFLHARVDVFDTMAATVSQGSTACSTRLRRRCSSSSASAGAICSRTGRRWMSSRRCRAR